MEDISLSDILRGKVNVDHRGTIRWRFIGPSGKIYYLTVQTLQKYFQGVQKEMDDVITSLEE